MLKEVKGLKCPHHDLIRDDHHFRYQEVYPGARPLESTRCMRCGFTMSLLLPLHLETSLNELVNGC